MYSSHTQKSNFLVKQMDRSEVMRKREDFAISLRKEKKKAIIQIKRRKIALLTKGKNQLAKSETSDVQPYRGYPKWKSDLYEEHSKILL